jgi:hypothetical protein
MTGPLLSRKELHCYAVISRDRYRLIHSICAARKDNAAMRDEALRATQVITVNIVYPEIYGPSNYRSDFLAAKRKLPDWI